MCLANSNQFLRHSVLNESVENEQLIFFLKLFFHEKNNLGPININELYQKHPLKNELNKRVLQLSKDGFLSSHYY